MEDTSKGVIIKFGYNYYYLPEAHTQLGIDLMRNAIELKQEALNDNYSQKLYAWEQNTEISLVAAPPVIYTLDDFKRMKDEGTI